MTTYRPNRRMRFLCGEHCRETFDIAEEMCEHWKGLAMEAEQQRERIRRAIKDAEIAALEWAATVARNHWYPGIERSETDRPLGFYDGAHNHGIGIANAILAEIERREGEGE